MKLYEVEMFVRERRVCLVEAHDQDHAETIAQEHAMDRNEIISLPIIPRQVKVTLNDHDVVIHNVKEVSPKSVEWGQ